MLSLTDLAKKFSVTPAAISYQLNKLDILRVPIGKVKVKYFINKVTQRVLGQIRYYTRRAKQIFLMQKKTEQKAKEKRQFAAEFKNVVNKLFRRLNLPAIS